MTATLIEFEATEATLESVRAWAREQAAAAPEMDPARAARICHTLRSAGEDLAQAS